MWNAGKQKSIKDFVTVLRDSLGVHAESQIQELVCSRVIFDQKFSISVFGSAHD